MRARLSNFWEQLQSSYLFLPIIMTLFALLLSFVTISIDGASQLELGKSLGWLWSGGAEGARSLLSTIAGSLITVASLVFSINIVALSIASSQFGPRMLRNVMRDKSNQMVLGTFVATFLYSLLVLRTVRSGEAEFVPYVSVTISLLLALISLAVLIYFIHHISMTIQASQVISTVADDLLGALEHVYPTHIGADPQQATAEVETKVPRDFASEARVIPATHSGYVVTVDSGRLLKVSEENDLVLSLPHRPGKFVVENDALVRAWPAERVNDKLVEKLQHAFVLDRRRVPTHDVEFGVRQMVEIAVRALSPGINDPYTAITCVDWLGAALSRAAEQTFPSRYRYGGEGKLRVIVEDPETFAGLVDAAFNQIRQYARSDAAVTIRLLETLAVIGGHTHRESDRIALRRHAIMIERGAREALKEELDRKDVHERFVAALQALHVAEADEHDADDALPSAQQAAERAAAR